MSTLEEYRTRLILTKHEVTKLEGMIESLEQNLLSGIEPGKTFYATVRRWPNVKHWPNNNKFRALFIMGTNGNFHAIDHHAPFGVGKTNYEYISDVEQR